MKTHTIFKAGDEVEHEGLKYIFNYYYGPRTASIFFRQDNLAFSFKVKVSSLKLIKVYETEIKHENTN